MVGSLIRAAIVCVSDVDACGRGCGGGDWVPRRTWHAHGGAEQTLVLGMTWKYSKEQYQIFGGVRSASQT
jgi:hypothetical protein